MLASNLRLAFELSCTDLCSPILTLHRPGPCMMPVPQFPYWPTLGGVNAANAPSGPFHRMLLNHLDRLGFGTLGLAVQLGRRLAPSPRMFCVAVPVPSPLGTLG